MEECFAVELGKRRGGRRAQFFFEEFTKQERLARQGLSALVVRKEVQEFIPENRNAAWLESNDGDASFDLGREFVEDFEEQKLCAIEHAEVIERPSAAEVGLGDEHAISGSLKDFDGGAGSWGQEVVVESVGPEQNLRD